MKPNYSYKLTEKTRNYIEKNKMIGHGDFVIVGLSGGADSVCLFLLLNNLSKKMDFSLMGVHVNHGIRGESANEDELFSKNLCEKFGVPFRSFNIDVPQVAKLSGLTLEEAGRNIRYSCFASCAYEKINELTNIKIAVAHHINDQAETVLFNMVRGSGLTGIGGIKPISIKSVNLINDSNNKVDLSVIRPLLCLTKEEIVKYLNEENQEYKTDETNLENEYSRNSIRNEIMPVLKQIQTRSPEHIASTADDIREANEYIDSVVQGLFLQYVTANEDKSEYRIKVKPIKSENPYIVRQLIIYVLRNMIETYKDITKAHILDIYSLFEKGRGKHIILPYNLIAYREREYIKITKN